MASLKDIKHNITAIQQTQKLTKAMNMVAASKLRSVQSKAEQFSSFASAYDKLLIDLVDRITDTDNPLMKEVNSNKIAIVAFSSDRGLCGAFNYNIFKKIDIELKSIKNNNFEADLFLIGRKLYDYYKKRPVNLKDYQVGLLDNFDFMVSIEIANKVIDLFLSGEYKEVKLIFTEFERISYFKPIIKNFLPVSAVSLKEETDKIKQAISLEENNKTYTEYLIEPSSNALLKQLLPKSLSILIYKAMLDSSTSENAARMQAMDNANENCTELISELTLLYNKARQAAVTTELLDIIGGAEALKG